MVGALPQTWSSTCNVLEAVLLDWVALETYYRDEEAAFPLADNKTRIEELYSLLKPVVVLINNAGKAGEPTGVASFLEMVALRTSVLHMGKDLRIQSPNRQAEGADSSTVGQSQSQPQASAVKRAPAALDEVTVSTRQILADAIDKRFFSPRYARVDGESKDYLFEMAVSMHPCLARLQFLGAVCSAEEQRKLKRVVRRKIVDLMASMADKVDAVARASGEVGREGDGQSEIVQAPGGPASKKRKVGICDKVASMSGRRVEEEAQHLIESGMFGEPSSCQSLDQPKSTREICDAEFNQFLDKGRDENLFTIPVSLLNDFWASEGERLYPNVARASRVLLGIPASSTMLGRGCRHEERPVPRPSSRTDAVYAEMVLLLNSSRERIPDKVPSLSNEEGKLAVPSRLGHPVGGEVAVFWRGGGAKSEGGVEFVRRGGGYEGMGGLL